MQECFEILSNYTPAYLPIGCYALDHSFTDTEGVDDDTGKHKAKTQVVVRVQKRGGGGNHMNLASHLTGKQ